MKPFRLPVNRLPLFKDLANHTADHLAKLAAFRPRGKKLYNAFSTPLGHKDFDALLADAMQYGDGPFVWQTFSSRVLSELHSSLGCSRPDVLEAFGKACVQLNLTYSDISFVSISQDDKDKQSDTPANAERLQPFLETGASPTSALTPPTNMNPYRKLLVIGLNEILSREVFSLGWDGESRVPAGNLTMIIAGQPSVVCWQDAGFGEIRISVWWAYDHDKHPQSDLTANSRERFTLPSPLANKRHYPKFVAAVCSTWLERKEGHYLQGQGSEGIFESYSRRGAVEQLKAMPDPQPSGFKAEGRLHM